ncbi:BTAD domain-containing putative transcriptional regulator [Actinocatenispora thailandica]
MRTGSAEPWELRRDRLLGAAYEAVVSSVVITGEPGAGKTTLLSQFARTLLMRGFEVCWGVVDRSAATNRLAVVSSTPARDLTGSRRRRSLSTEYLATLAENTAKPLAIVVDDVHLLTPGAQTAVSELIHRLPATVRFLLAGQFGAVECIGDLRMMRETTVLGTRELRFRRHEVEQLFRDVYAEPLSKAEVHEVAWRTEGWIAAIHTFHSITAGRSGADRLRVLPTLASADGPLREFLAAKVMASLTDDVRSLLVGSSPLPVLHPTVCDQLLDRRDSDAVLRWLAGRNFFITRLDSPAAGYRVPPLVRSYLQAELTELIGTEGFSDRCRQVGRLLAESGLAGAEPESSGSASEPDAGMRRASAVELQAEPAAGEPRPDAWRRVAAAHGNLDRGRLAAALADYDAALAELPEGPARRACMVERQLVHAWASPDPVRTPLVDEHWARMLREALRERPARVAELADAADTADGGHALVGGVAELLCGNQERARVRLDRASRSATPVIRQLAQLLRTAIDRSVQPPGRGPTDPVAEPAPTEPLWLCRLDRAARALSGDAELLERAERLALECAETGDRWGALLARLAVVIGRGAAGQLRHRSLLSCIEEAMALGAGVIAAWARVALARDAAQRGRPEAARLRVEADAAAASVGIPLGMVVPASTKPLTPPSAAWSARSPAVSIRCFGRYELSSGGQPLRWQALRPRVRSVLRLISLRAGHDVPVETLHEAFWPQVSVESARRNVHVAVSMIRSILEPGRDRAQRSMLERRGDAYHLTLPRGSDHDVQRFGAAMAAWRRQRTSGPAAAVGPLRAAVAAYTGELLPEDGAAEWLVEQRRSLRAEAVTAATALAAALSLLSEQDGVVEAAQHALRIDRFHDPAWRLLIEGYERAGDSAAARRARTEYTEMLIDLGIDPID